MDFFEQLGKSLTDAGQDVAQHTKNLSEVAKLNMANSEKGNEIARIYTAIGHSYYERHKNDSSSEERDKIDRINALYNEIGRNKQRLNELKGGTKELICPQCQAIAPINSMFCSRCGTKLQ